MDDVLHEVDMEDSVAVQLEQNKYDDYWIEWLYSRVTPLLDYCSVMEVCSRLGSVSTDDTKVLEKKL